MSVPFKNDRQLERKPNFIRPTIGGEKEKERESETEEREEEEEKEEKEK